MGVEFTGGGSGSIVSDNFAGATDNTTDLQIDASAGVVTDGGSNHFAGATFITDLASGLTLDASGDTFAGIAASGFTLAQAYATEDHINDVLDTPGDGYVELNATNVYVSQLSDTTTNNAIERGVNVAGPAATVHIENGTYKANVVLNNPITIEGDSQSGVTILPLTGGGSSQTAFLVASSNVTIEALTIDGQTGIAAPDQFSRGVITNYSSPQFLGINAVVYNNLVAQNLTVDNVSSRRIDFKNQGTGYQIISDTLHNAGEQAITVIGGSGVIENNTVTDTTGANGNTGIAVNALYDSFNNAFAPLLTISGNHITGDNAAIYASATAAGTIIGGATPADANVLDVTGSGTFADGIVISFAQGSATIEGNTIATETSGDGIVLFNDGASPVDIVSNSISATGASTGTGIYITDDGSATRRIRQRRFQCQHPRE